MDGGCKLDSAGGMKLIAYDSARAVQFFIMEEVRPQHGLDIPKLYDALTNRYGFASRTTDLTQAASNGMRFAQGRLSVGNIQTTILELQIYNDGIIASCPTSDEADRVLGDLMTWAAATLGLRAPQTPRPRRYTSFVTVEFDLVPDSKLNRFGKTQQALTEAVRALHGEERRFDLQRIGLAIDPQVVGPFAHTPFFVERRIGVSYAQNRFWSGAPLKNEDHLRILATFEAELAA